MTANIEASDEPGPASSLTFVGTATTVLRLGSFTVLTDPNFLHRGERAYLGYGLSSRRRTEPMAIPDDLTAIDAVVLSPCTATTSTAAPGHNCPPACRSPPPVRPNAGCGSGGSPG